MVGEFALRWGLVLVVRDLLQWPNGSHFNQQYPDLVVDDILFYWLRIHKCRNQYITTGRFRILPMSDTAPIRPASFPSSCRRYRRWSPSRCPRYGRLSMALPVHTTRRGCLMTTVNSTWLWKQRYVITVGLEHFDYGRAVDKIFENIELYGALKSNRHMNLKKKIHHVSWVGCEARIGYVAFFWFRCSWEVLELNVNKALLNNLFLIIN